VVKSDQTITFTAPGPRTLGDAPFTVSATSSSGLPVTFTVPGGGPCTISGATVTITAAGTCSITANQAGNANYKAAPSVTRDVNIAPPAKVTPTISTQASAGGMVGTPVKDTATLAGGAARTGSVTFRLYSDASCSTQAFTSTDTLSGLTTTSGWFTPSSPGTYRWTALYSGDANKNSALSPCNAPGGSVTLTPFQAPAYTQTVSGDLAGPLTVASGQSLLINTGARVAG
jgi:hypothetical protein